MDYSRNWLFLDKMTQRRLAELRVLVAGVGIGSNFATLALRTGIRHFIIADGDIVDASNLNRQDYLASDIGVNKAVACKRRLEAIDPSIKVEAIPRYLNHEDLKGLLSRVDIVTNTIDFDREEFLICHNLAKDLEVTELFPINLGFGGCVSVHDHSSPSFETAFSSDTHGDLKQRILTHLIKSGHLEDYLPEAAERYWNGPGRDYDPQMGTSVAVVSALMVSLIVKLVAGISVKKFPETYYLDPFGERLVS